MKQIRSKKHYAFISSLMGMIALLIVLMGITGCSTAQQQSPNSGSENSGAYPKAYQIQFEQEWKRNPDFKGYLTLEGTSLSTNVVQGTDNTFYREHGFDGSSETRIAFLDYRVNIETPSTQTLIYLPHVENNIKYGELVNFKNLEYYQEHPVISFNSLYRNAKYKIFAVTLFPSGYEGLPFQTCMETNDRAQMVELVQQAMAHSILDIPVDVRQGDELLTVMSEDLSLRDENGKDARIAIFARKIREGESEAVNTQKAAIKVNPYIPEAWRQQILHNQNLSAVNEQIRKEAANWFTAVELSKIHDADLERMMIDLKAEYKKYLTDQEMLLSAEEKAYLYEQRLNEAVPPVLTLDAQNVTARVGEEFTLTVQRAPQNPNATYEWVTSSSSIVSIKADGTRAKLTAHKEGAATIYVSSGNTTVACLVEVKDKDKFVLNPSTMTIWVDNSYNIKASSEIDYATTSNSDVARLSVNKNQCNVYGVAPGEATVTVYGKNGMSATCKVTVKKYQLTFDKTSLDMKIGSRRNIYVSTGEAANWYVDNSSVVRMSIVENGKAVLIEAVGAGTATVTATARNGAQATCKITVNGTGVAFNTTYMDLKKGETKELRVTSGNVARWEISDRSVTDICVYSNGRFVDVEGLASGTATVKAYGTDGSVATLNVTVSEPQQSLTITPYSMTVTQGDLRNIVVTSGSASNWVSSNSNVAEVYVIGDGTMAQVEGKNPGSATITVYDRLGGWVNCNVTVEASAPRLVVGPGELVMNPGDWEDLSVISGRAVDWSSTNSDVVGVYVIGGDNNNVRLKANNTGSAQVIAYAADGSTAVCNVTVNAPYTPQKLTLNHSTFSFEEGDQLDLRVADGFATNWSCSDPSVASIEVVGDGSAVLVTAHRAGTTVITVHGDNGLSASCTVTVHQAATPTVPQEPVTLNKTNLVMNEGDWFELKAISGTCVNWNSTNSNIVRLFDVHEPNQINLRADTAGTCQIIAYAADGTTTICNVTVIPFETPTEMVDPDPVFYTASATEPTVEVQPDPIPEPETEPEPIPEPETNNDSDAGNSDE